MIFCATNWCLQKICKHADPKNVGATHRNNTNQSNKFVFSWVRMLLHDFALVFESFNDQSKFLHLKFKSIRDVCPSVCPSQPSYASLNVCHVWCVYLGALIVTRWSTTTPGLRGAQQWRRRSARRLNAAVRWVGKELEYQTCQHNKALRQQPMVPKMEVRISARTICGFPGFQNGRSAAAPNGRHMTLHWHEQLCGIQQSLT